MQKAFTGILLLLMINFVHGQSWTPASPNIYFTGGKVGIGTSNPQWPLHLSASTVNGTDCMIEATNDSYATLNLKSVTKIWQWSMRPTIQNNSIQLWYYDPAVSSSFQGPFLSVMPSGNVGIGYGATQIPYYKLDILTSNTNDGLKLTTSNGWVLLHGNNLGSYAYSHLTQAGDGGIIYGNSSNVVNFGFVIAPWNNSSAGFRMDKTGNVGIGTASTNDATYKLFVETGIRTRKITVDQSTWPDYVFHPSYNLPSLSTIATYIRNNGHLPDVPSADSVSRNGVDLGNNQAVLLKKIEELTLYSIQQQEQIEKQNRLLKKMQSEIDELKSTKNTTIK
jgi:hypothetical protein